MKDCWKCKGTGYIAKYAHIKDGQCFACGGTGKLDDNRVKELSKENADKFVKSGKMSHFIGIENLPPEYYESAEFKNRYNSVRERIGLFASDDVNPAEFEMVVKLARALDGAEETVAEVKQRDYDDLADLEDFGEVDDIDIDFELLMDDLEDDEEVVATAPISFSSSYEDEINNMSHSQRMKFYRDFQYLKHFHKAKNMPSHLISRFNALGFELAERVGISEGTVSGTWGDFDFEYLYDEINDNGVLETMLGENYREEYVKEPKPSNPLEFSNAVNTIYEGERFPLSDIPTDIGMGSNVNVIMPDGEVFNLTYDYDKENEREVIAFNMDTKVPVQNRKEIGEGLSNISSKIKTSHVSLIGYGAEYLANNRSEIEEILKRNTGFKSSLTNYARLTKDILNPKVSASDKEKTYNDSKVAMRIFTPEELNYFLYPDLISSKLNADEKLAERHLGFMDDWYGVGGRNYSTSAVTKTLEDVGFVNSGVDHLKQYYERYYKDNETEDASFYARTMDSYREFFSKKYPELDFYTSATLKTYLLTQMFFQMEEVEEVELFRGLKRDDASDYEPRTFESWSANKAVARRFANSSRAQGGSIMTRKVNREDILFSNDVFPMGEYDVEEEYVPIFEKGDKNFTWERS